MAASLEAELAKLQEKYEADEKAIREKFETPLREERANLISEIDQRNKRIDEIDGLLGQKKRGRRSSTAPAGARAPRGQRQQQVLDYVKANPGCRPADIAIALGIANTQVSGLLKKLRDEGSAKKDGSTYTAT